MKLEPEKGRNRDDAPPHPQIPKGIWFIITDRGGDSDIIEEIINHGKFPIQFSCGGFRV